jgi:hypothetical protein
MRFIWKRIPCRSSNLIFFKDLSEEDPPIISSIKRPWKIVRVTWDQIFVLEDPRSSTKLLNNQSIPHKCWMGTGSVATVQDLDLSSLPRNGHGLQYQRTDACCIREWVIQVSRADSFLCFVDAILVQQERSFRDLFGIHGLYACTLETAKQIRLAALKLRQWLERWLDLHVI